jgi:hypothetical protein
MFIDIYINIYIYIHTHYVGMSNRSDSSRQGEGGYVYLVEVQYFIKLQTGQAMFVALPRHIYGELARSQMGLELLEEKYIYIYIYM